VVFDIKDVPRNIKEGTYQFSDLYLPGREGGRTNVQNSKSSQAHTHTYVHTHTRTFWLFNVDGHKFYK
jgi:hypothetical protein